MKGFTIKVIKEDDRVQIIPEDLNIDEFIVLGGTSLELALKSAYNQKKPEIKDDKEDKEFRAALYDRLILITTEIAQGIYPEYVDLYNKTPEALLAELDKKVKIIKDAESNK